MPGNAKPDMCLASFCGGFHLIACVYQDLAIMSGLHDRSRMSLFRFSTTPFQESHSACPTSGTTLGGRWFCDAQGENEQWHACALPNLESSRFRIAT